MMTQLDVIVIFDAAQLLKAGAANHDSKQPIPVANGLNVLVTAQGHMVSSDPSGSLHLSIKAGDTIRWWAVSATVTPAYTLAIYQFAFAQGQDLFSPAQLSIPDVQLFYPASTTNPLKFVSQQIHAPYWSLEAQAGGTAVCNLSFAILQPSNPTPLGYYSIQVQLTVTQPAKMINIMAIVDPAGIPISSTSSPDPKQPVKAPTGSIFLVAQPDNALAGNGSAELQLAASPGDTICWQAIGLPLATTSTIALYDLQVTSGPELLSAPQIAVGSAAYPVPNPANPTVWKFQNGPIYHWSVDALATGEAIYRLSFAILDDHQQLKGYYFWEARITIAGSPGQGTPSNQSVASGQSGASLL